MTSSPASPPADDEEVIVYTGEPDTLMTELSEVRGWQAGPSFCIVSCTTRTGPSLRA